MRHYALLYAAAATADAAHAPSWVTDARRRLGELSARRRANTAGTIVNSNALDATGCSAKRADGGWGYCGPASCADAFLTCVTEEGDGGPHEVGGVTGQWAPAASGGATCKPFLSRSEGASGPDLVSSDFSLKGACAATCTAQSSGVCSSEFLAAVFSPHDGVKAAFCNDEWLVVTATGEYAAGLSNLNDIPSPPGKQGTNKVTGEATVSFDRPQELFFPLATADLPAAVATNNVEVYDNPTGVGPKSFLKDTSLGLSYGLPADGTMAMAVNGLPIFPGASP